jgi:HSP20 family protein
MTLTLWDPFRDLWVREGKDADARWAPPVDILEKGEDLVIRAELPGVAAEAIDVRVEDNVLHLSGERKQENETEQGKTYRRERVYGSFSRSFSLPKTVDAARIAASHSNGVLEIVLPKAEEAKPRRVEIRAA